MAKKLKPLSVKKRVNIHEILIGSLSCMIVAADERQMTITVQFGGPPDPRIIRVLDPRVATVGDHLRILTGEELRQAVDKLDCFDEYFSSKVEKSPRGT